MSRCECGCGYATAGGRFLPGHNIIAKHAKRDHAGLFWARVKSGSADECWPWTSRATHRYGYGMLTWRSRATVAHRVAWELTHGTIPEGMVVRHSCDNTICCNPGHLLIGSHSQNMGDAADRARMPRDTRHHGATPITFNGETHAVAVWARRIGLHPQGLAERLKKGWPIARALTEPAHHHGRRRD